MENNKIIRKNKLKKKKISKKKKIHENELHENELHENEKEMNEKKLSYHDLFLSYEQENIEMDKSNYDSKKSIIFI
tara:strand:- start:101 stop:328 length:228 start_codon:yes stop_codon:yes gene_type:complete